MTSDFGLRHRDAALKSADTSAHSKLVLSERRNVRVKVAEPWFWTALRLV